MQANSCCSKWREKYSKLEEKRNALRQAVKLLEQQIKKIEAENLNLKKAYEEEQARAESEKEGKEKELAVRVSLENEISALKSEITSLQQKGCSDAQDRNEKITYLQVRVSEGEKDISRLKELIEKEKTKAESEKKKADAEKKKASEAWKYVKAEKGKADEEKRLANIEGKKAEEYRLQLEALKKEADEAKSKLVSQNLKFEEESKKLEGEKQKVAKEKKRADSEMAKAEEQRKLAEENRKSAMEERCRSENLSQQLNEARRKIQELQNEIHEPVFSGNSCGAHGDQPGKNTNADVAKMKKRLSLEKLKKDVGKSKLVLEYLKSEEANKMFEVEKKKAVNEKNRADSEMVKAVEQRKLAEVNQQKAMEEKCRADHLSRQLEKARLKIEELQKQIDELLSSRKMFKASAVTSDKDMNADIKKVKLLKNQLKFQKARVKLAKDVAKLEKRRNSILQQELGCLKLEFVQFSHRLDILDKCFSPGAEGIDELEKTGNFANMQSLKLKVRKCGLESSQMYLQCQNELLKPICTDMDVSDPFKQTFPCAAPLLPITGGNFTKYISGIDSKLESFLGGSNRKMLQSSASFSDGQLVGSQGSGSFSVATSMKLVEENLNAQPTITDMSGEVTKMRCNKNLAVAAENSVRSPLKIGVVGRVNGNSRKRKRILDAIESIDFLHYEGKKLHQRIEDKLSVLQGELSKQTDKHLEESGCMVPNVQGNSNAKHVKFQKKRKACHEEIDTQHFCCTDELKKTENVENEFREANIFRELSRPANNLIGTAQICRDGITDSFTSDLETMVNFEDVAEGDFMKLLDLDNAADEECYRTALEMPLSPTLPEIEFRGIEIDVDNAKPLLEDSFFEGLLNEKENTVPSCSFDVINVEINSNETKYNISSTSHDLLLHKNDDPVDSFDRLGINGNGFCHTMQAEEAYVSQTRECGVEVGMSSISSAGDHGIRSPFESELGFAHSNIPKNCVMFSNIKDSSSISRIFCATRTCLARCSLVTQMDWVVPKILLALKMEEKLSSKEKVCVFFSLLLLNFSTAALGKPGNIFNRDFMLCLDSFAGHINAVTADVEARVMFDELCLDELLSLIEDFLINGGVMMHTDLSSELFIECDSIINICMDGVNISLSSEAASADQLVAGSIILVSICAAMDLTGLICEASYNIFRTHRCDTSVVLTILHVFSYLGGEKYFNLSEYSLTMAVLKSLVTFLERGSLSLVAAASCLSSANEVQVLFQPCAECPFSEDAVSVDIMISLLLEKLQNYAQSGTRHQQMMESASSSNSAVLCHKDKSEQSSSHQEVHYVHDKNCNATCCSNKCRMPATQSESVVNETLSHFIDVLSLVELLGCNMGWDWTYGKIVLQLLKMLESPMLENFAVGIVVLLGQLGRRRVDAGGYEDGGVENLISKLSAFLCKETTTRAGLPIQIATVGALLGLLYLDFARIIENNVKLPSIVGQSVPIDLIRNWFSLLSKEQQAQSFSLIQSAGVN